MLDLLFWKQKALNSLSHEEWESLCDGCGKCCLHKLRDEDSDEIVFTNVACRFLDLESCRCTHYRERHRLVPSCIRLSAESLRDLACLPVTCAYRLLLEGSDLPSWHPLVSGSNQSVHEAGVSVRAWVIPEDEALALEAHVIHWRP